MAALNVNSGRLTLPASTAIQVSAGSLLITGSGTFDIGAGVLMVDDETTTLATIRQYLASGYNAGQGNGVGIISSWASQPGRAIGYADGTFGAPTGTIMIRGTLAGDADLDRSVGFADMVRVAQHYGANSGSSLWTEGDFNYDGNVGFADLVKVAQNYGISLPALSATPAPMVPSAPVSEPAPQPTPVSSAPLAPTPVSAAASRQNSTKTVVLPPKPAATQRPGSAKPPSRTPPRTLSLLEPLVKTAPQKSRPPAQTMPPAPTFPFSNSPIARNFHAFDDLEKSLTKFS